MKKVQFLEHCHVAPLRYDLRRNYTETHLLRPVRFYAFMPGHGCGKRALQLASFRRSIKAAVSFYATAWNRLIWCTVLGGLTKKLFAALKDKFSVGKNQITGIRSWTEVRVRGPGESRSTMEVETLNGTLVNTTRLLPQITSSDQSIEGGNSTQQLFFRSTQFIWPPQWQESGLGARLESRGSRSWPCRAHGQKWSFTAVITGSRRYYDTLLLDALILLPATNATITLKIVE